MTAAFVTGAGGGIGRAVALRFARAGSAVTVVDIDPAKGEETADLVRQTGAAALFIRADVANGQDVEAAVMLAAGGGAIVNTSRSAGSRSAAPGQRLWVSGSGSAALGQRLWVSG
jgi:NADP-dependent 3-hydroxy acid dehydrogenase YdfG